MNIVLATDINLIKLPHVNKEIEQQMGNVFLFTLFSATSFDLVSLGIAMDS